MARGVQPSLEQQWEEASMEVQAIVAAELTAHDRWELEAFRAKAGLIAAAIEAIDAGRPSVAISHLTNLQAIVTEARRRNLDEDRAHIRIHDVARAGVA